MRLASVRRSLFTNDAARSKFLVHLMTGTKDILQTGQGVFIIAFVLLIYVYVCGWLLNILIFNYYFLEGADGWGELKVLVESKNFCF